ncbi:hypothetical protein HYH02_006477 [Chlamydomonas schloesseri]|uniref:Methyltransferase domain-containing protein n=1 Tax=Chlamydomonas schloesseri TaxID=2026947 RepID=A0A835WJI9_9CHLO|nr:hypothetical protein HYH02_006477 [Chlamydomonas schloesseri]|eukprot:KAG2448586.1 hypothetical protein HYH02_006477 [Chlamydomonas schloesseri]
MAQTATDTASFEPGDIVDVKGHGRATVLAAATDSPGDPHRGRCHIRYHEDGTTYWARPQLLRRMRPASRRLLVARHTYSYRDAMVHNVERPDVCLEIGCHEGLTTNMISNRATFVTGIDTAPEVVAIAAARHPHLPFSRMDGLDTAATAALAPAGCSFSLVCIDISGKAPLDLICEMIRAQAAAFPAARLIVKNEELYDALVALEQQQQGEAAQEAPEQQQQQKPAPAAVQTPEQAAAAAAAEAAAAARGRAGAARLLQLLGAELLAECELFRHQFRPPRLQPPERWTQRQLQHQQAQQHQQAAGEATS